MIKLSKPDIPESAIALVVEVLRSGNLVQGKYVAELEARLAQWLEVAECVCVSSCTAALHLAVLALELPPGSEAIVPGFTFPATANAAELAGAYTRPVDISLSDYCIEPDAIEAAITSATRLLIPVHEFGQAADMDAIMHVATRYRLVLLEDAACALGAEFGGKKCGTFGALGCYSFHPRKALTTGEGGAVVTNDPALAAKIRILRNHGIDASGGVMNFIRPGFNYRMTDFQAALCLDQLRDFAEQIEYRRNLASCYTRKLAAIPWIAPPKELPKRKMVYQTYHVLLDDYIDRAELITYMGEHGVETNLGAQALSQLVCYRDHVSAGGCPNAERAARHGLALPMGRHVSHCDVDDIVGLLAKFKS